MIAITKFNSSKLEIPEAKQEQKQKQI